MKRICWSCLLLSVTIAGCGGPVAVRPGTRGRIHKAEQPLADVRITLHRIEGNEITPVGFGVSNPQGKFGLFQEKAAGPLWLQPAEYAITLQSEGAIPFSWPTDYQDPSKTPLKRSWSKSDIEMDLDVPAPLPLQEPSRRVR